jgi:imidazoleglycerol-phosphate dehydratase
MRTASITRNTAETQIALTLNLTLLAKHGGFDLTIRATGDVHVDDHHLTEDLGIALGLALREALGDKRGIRRYGSLMLPMDEALMLAAVDCSGRPFFAWDVAMPSPKVGGWDTELAEDFFRALAVSADPRETGIPSTKGTLD